MWEEFDLIRRLTRAEPAVPAAGGVCLGVGDDAAILRLPAGSRVVVTTDAMVEGVHFRRDWSSAGDVGWKLLAASVSDLNAMGARPLAAVVSLCLPPSLPSAWAQGVSAGLEECAARYGCPVVGGDTTRSPDALVLGLTALGVLPEAGEARRDRARPGDLLCVTGVVGESAAGLALLARGGPWPRRLASTVDWHRRPQPPADAGPRLLAAGLPTAMIDLSDGLASDLRRLAEASRVGFVVDSGRLPVSIAARQAARLLAEDAAAWALSGGEDYQLLFTIPPERWEEVPPALSPAGVAATVIGRTVGSGLRVRDPAGKSRPLPEPAFRHFSPRHPVAARPGPDEPAGGG